MPNDIRFKYLERARLVGLSGDYVGAYRILEALLISRKDDVEVRRLYGNLLEADGLSESDSRLTWYKLRDARRQYREILKIDSCNLYALFDLADQMARFRRYRCAKSLYTAFLESQARTGEAGYDDEIAEASGFLFSYDKRRIVSDL